MSKSTDKAIEVDNHMKLWESVTKTDPRHTKQVTYGRNFTAIDAHWQVMQATKTFGPVGDGWGYKTKFGQHFLDDGVIVAWCDLTLWWRGEGEWEGNKVRARKEYGPVRGSALLRSLDKSKKPKLPDTDAYKKCMTDALTKALSHLGFSADVFLGMFDDNKYVQQRTTEVTKEEEAKQKDYREKRQAFIAAVRGASSSKKIEEIIEKHSEWIATLDSGTAQEMKSWATKVAKELEDGSKQGNADRQRGESTDVPQDAE